MDNLEVKEWVIPNRQVTSIIFLVHEYMNV